MLDNYNMLRHGHVGNCIFRLPAEITQVRRIEENRPDSSVMVKNWHYDEVALIA